MTDALWDSRPAHRVRSAELLELRFPVPCPPVSENKVRGHHWSQTRAQLEPWQGAVRAAWSQAASGRARAANVPCRIEMEIPFPNHRRRDPHNYTGTVVKVCVDALVRSGAFPDDSPEWVQIVDPVLTVGTEVVIRLVPRLSEAEALGSRAVLRPIEPAGAGSDTPRCAGCNERLVFQGWMERKTRQQVICNVYENGRWARVEHWHKACYKEAGEPCGKATA